jgi:hypothetical protein
MKLLIFIVLGTFYSALVVAGVTPPPPPPPEVMPQPEIVQAPPSNSQTGSYSMAWNGYIVEGTTYSVYRNDSFVKEGRIFALSPLWLFEYSENGIAFGTYYYQVKYCNLISDINVCSELSIPAKVVVNPSPINTINFIHTDVLGTPVAETDINGDIQ